MVTFYSVNFKGKVPLVETSVDDRIILIGLDENGCECAGSISLFLCIAKWRDFTLLTDTEQE